MWQFTCENCGAKEYTLEKNNLICSYCHTRYKIQKGDPFSFGAKIDLVDDINMLVSKCIKEPHNAKRYANIILEMDPYNQFARRYI